MLEALKVQVAAWGLEWSEFKDFGERASGVSHDALHVIAGVLAQLALVALFRTSLARLWPWGLVLLAELVNEWNDYRVERWSEVGLQWGEMTKDLGLTMLLPTVLLLAARWRPALFGLK